MEIELAWGGVFKDPDNRYSMLSGPERELESKRLNQLLDICDQYNIPISFNVVGHLLHDECTNHQAPHTQWFKKHDPMSNKRSDPCYYAPDLVEEIRDRSVSHEICTHTYSHIPIDEVSDDVIKWEITEAQKTHEKNGYYTPTSLIPPQHRHTPLEVVEEAGISVIRTSKKDGTPLDGYPEDGSAFERFLWNLRRNPPIEEPRWNNGVLQVFCSSSPSLTSLTLPSGQNDPHPVFQMIPQSIRKKIQQRFLESSLDAANAGDHVHQWCHLYDLANDVQWPIVREFMHDVGQSFEKGLEIKTLKQLSKIY